MLRAIIKILFIAVALDANAGAYEDYQDDKVIIFYECFTCADMPNINHPAYAAQFPPTLTTTRESAISADLRRLLRVEGTGRRTGERCDTILDHASLMVIGLDAYPILVDNTGKVQMGGYCSVISTEAVQSIHELLWPYREPQ